MELYHLPADPRQVTNVAERHPGVGQDLQRAYAVPLEETGTAEAYRAPRRALSSGGGAARGGWRWLP